MLPRRRHCRQRILAVAHGKDGRHVRTSKAYGSRLLFCVKETGTLKTNGISILINMNENSVLLKDPRVNIATTATAHFSGILIPFFFLISQSRTAINRISRKHP